MADYATEDEQLEALKRWWQENGRSVIFGIVVAIGIVGGWQGWQWHTAVQEEGAAAIYNQALAEMPMGDAGGVVSAAETLRSDYGRTTYATLGALAAARMMVRDNDYDAAVDWLEWARDHARDDSLAAIAGVRLARVLGERGDTDRALAILDGQAAAGWAALHHEVRGDLLAARGDFADAADAYEQALASEGRVTDRDIVELKLNRVRGGRTPVRTQTES